MATLKGQNLRVGTLNGTTFTVFAMATTNTITRNTQTDDASTKDDAGMSSKPTVTSKSTQIQVESLNVLDMATMLTAIKNLTPFTLMWDETDTSNNQTALQADLSRYGQFYLTDATFTFNDRENSVKNLQFISTGAISGTGFGDITTTVVSAGSYTKGQFVRLFLSSDNTTAPAKVIAAAKQLSFHVSVAVENATTKDTEGNDEVQEPTGITFDITTNALVRGNDTITSSVDAQDFASIEEIYEAVTPVKFQIANVSGANQRTKGSVIVSGSVIIQTLTLNDPNRQNATYTANLTGYGSYTVGA